MTNNEADKPARKPKDNPETKKAANARRTTSETTKPNQIINKATSKLTDAVRDELCRLIRDRYTLEGAAAKVGIDRKRIHSWLEAGRQATEGPYFEFAQAYDSAQADLERDLAVAVEQAALGKSAKGAYWQAGMTFLERRFPERWSRPEIRLSNEIKQPSITLVLTKTQDALAANESYQLLPAGQDTAPDEEGND